MAVIKDEYTLSKNAWHARMMKYMWKLDPEDFSHMCPYFWLSFLNCLLFIPYFAIREGIMLSLKVIFYPFKLIANWAEKGIKRYNERMKIVHNKREARKKAKEKVRREIQIAYYKANPEKLLALKEKNEDKYRTIIQMIRWESGEDFRTLQDKIEEVKERLQIQEENKKMEAEAAKARVFLEQKKEHFKKIYDGPTPIEELIEGDAWVSYYENYERMRAKRRQELIEARRRARKALIVKLVKIAKPIGTFVIYGAGIVVVSVVLYYGWMFLSWLGTRVSNAKVTINWNEVGHVSLYTFYIIAILAAAFGIIYSFLKSIPYTYNRYLNWRYDVTCKRMQEEKPEIWETNGDKISYMNNNAFISVAARLRSVKNIMETGYTETSDTYRRRKQRRYAWISKPAGKIASSFMYVVGVFPWMYRKWILPVCRGIYSGVVFLIQMAKDRCPAIKWKQ